MKSKKLIYLNLIFIATLISCSQAAQENKSDETETNETSSKTEPHKYGGWFCPDNVGGFPPVDLADWKSVPVVNGRMATVEETQNGTSLINVDTKKYPNAKPLDMTMPRLARHFCTASQKEELIIIIQALNVSNDSIVGFRYLNGGNGSARLSEVTILSDDEIEKIESSRFVVQVLDINAHWDKVWDVLTKTEYYSDLSPVFDPETTLDSNWCKQSKVNFKYIKDLTITSEYAGELFGNRYIQIDWKQNKDGYVEKFLLGQYEESNTSRLSIVCGPYADDFETQNEVITSWAQKVKEVSENL